MGFHVNELSIQRRGKRLGSVGLVGNECDGLGKNWSLQPLPSSLVINLDDDLKYDYLARPNGSNNLFVIWILRIYSLNKDCYLPDHLTDLQHDLIVPHHLHQNPGVAF